MVAQAIFHVVGVIRVARPVLPRDLAIILGPLVDILDHHRDRRAGRDHGLPILVHDEARQDAHLIRLAALRDEPRLSGTTLVEVALDVGEREADAGRTTVDDAAKGGAMALAPGGDAKQMSEGVVRHENRSRST